MSKHAHAKKVDGHDRSKPPPVDVDVLKARGQARLVHAHVADIPSQRMRLLEAKLMGDPRQIRLAAADFERTKLLLEIASAVITYAVMLPGGDAKDLVDACEVARRIANDLAAEVRKALEIAHRLEGKDDGALAKLRGDDSAASEPDQVRARAARNTPLGLCDDSELQRPDSHVCPLGGPQRAAIRAKVILRIGSIADAWRDAIQESALNAALADLAADHGLHPLLTLLLDAGSAFVGGKAASALVKYADRQTAEQLGLAFLPSDTSWSIMPLRAAALKQGASTLPSLAKKLADRAKAAAASAPKTPNDLHRQANEIARSWRDNAQIDVAQLTDPDLVTLSEGLDSTPFDRAYFDAKMTRLVTEYHPVVALGTVNWTGHPLRLAWVTSAGRPARLAAVRPRLCDRVAGFAECAFDVAHVLRHDGSTRLDFEAWIDPSLYEVALARGSEPIGVDAKDARWATSPIPWTAPDDDEGLTLLGLHLGENLK